MYIAFPAMTIYGRQYLNWQRVAGHEQETIGWDVMLLIPEADTYWLLRRYLPSLDILQMN